jgi:hypothetical protein
MIKFMDSVLLSITIIITLLVSACGNGGEGGRASPTPPTYSLPVDRNGNWTGTVGVPGGIPTNRSKCGSTLPTSSTSAEINSAIAGCTAGTFVELASGTFNLTTNLYVTKDNVTLRGSVDSNGNPATTINFSSASGMYYEGAIWIGGNDGTPALPSISKNWTAGYTQGATVITLNNVTGLSAGMFLVLDQLNDSGDIYKGVTGEVNSDGSEGYCAYCSLEDGTRAQQEIVKIVSIDGNNVTITPGLRMPNWSSLFTPHATAFDFSFGQGIGLENVIINGDSGIDADNIISVSGCDGCWLKNVWTRTAATTLRAHISIFYCYRFQMNRCDLRYNESYESMSYGMWLIGSGGCLIEDNIFYSVTGAVLPTNGSTGNVVAYNYSLNMRYDDSPAWMQPMVSYHAAHSSMNLMEGNIANSISSDFIHGSSSRNVMFRNYLNGWETNKTAQTVPIALSAWGYYYSAVGNVLGKSGYHDTYNCSSPTTIDGCETSIFALGMSGECTQSCTWPDGLGHNPPVENYSYYDFRVSSTMLRHGNYDVVHAAQTKCNHADNTGGCFNSNPNALTLPNSLYLASAPPNTWWCSESTFPPIDPSTGTIHDIPAKRRYDNTTCTLRGVSGTTPPTSSN